MKFFFYKGNGNEHRCEFKKSQCILIKDLQVRLNRSVKFIEKALFILRLLSSPLDVNTELHICERNNRTKPRAVLKTRLNIASIA